MKDKTAGAAIEEYVGFKPNMYSFLVNGNNDHRKPKGVTKNTVATISHNEIKDILLNNKCLRHSMNRAQSKNHKIGTCAVNKYFLSCFDDKIFILNNRYDRNVNYTKTVIILDFGIMRTAF